MVANQLNTTIMPDNEIEFTYSISTEDMKLRTNTAKIDILDNGNGMFWSAGNHNGPCSASLDMSAPMHFSHFADKYGVEVAMLLNKSDKGLTPLMSI